MHSPSKYEQLQTLSRQIDLSHSLFNKLKSINSHVKKYANWHDLINYLKPGRLRSPPCDNILRSIISQLNNKSINGVTEILLIVFWPLLEIIYSKFNSKFELANEEKDKLWSNIQWEFLKVLNRIDLEDRKAPIASKVYNDIYHEIYQIIKTGLELCEKDKSLDSLTPDEIDEILGADEDQGLEFYYNNDELETCLKLSVIDELDYNILFRTIFNDDPLKAIAADLGIGYEAAKKRQQRAAKKVKEFLNKLSPNHEKHPLKRVGR